MSLTSPGRSGRLKPVSVTPPLREYIAELWRRRQFSVSMARGEYHSKNAAMNLGGWWHLINPLLQLGVYYLVFGVLVGTDRGVTNFIGFLAAGIFVFQYSQRSITGGASAISKNLSLIRSLQFPRALLPISALLREALALRVALVAAAVILLLSGERLTPWWLLALPLLLLQSMFNLGGALIAARLADRVRDIENVLPFVFRLLFYGSGVLFMVDRYIPDLGDPATEELVRTLFILNPLYCYLSLMRNYTMTTIEQESLDLMWISGATWAVLILVVGLIYFRAGESTYGRG